MRCLVGSYPAAPRHRPTGLRHIVRTSLVGTGVLDGPRTRFACHDASSCSAPPPFAARQNRRVIYNANRCDVWWVHTTAAPRHRPTVCGTLIAFPMPPLCKGRYRACSGEGLSSAAGGFHREADFIAPPCTQSQYPYTHSPITCVSITAHSARVSVAVGESVPSAITERYPPSNTA